MQNSKAIKLREGEITMTALQIKCRTHGPCFAIATLGGFIYCEKCLEERDKYATNKNPIHKTSKRPGPKRKRD